MTDPTTPTAVIDQYIDELLRRRETAQDELDAVIDRATRAGSTELTGADNRTYCQLFDDINEIDTRVATANELRRRLIADSRSAL